MDVQQVKVVVLGNSGVGKSSLLKQFAKGEFPIHYRATVGADFFSTEVRVQSSTVSLQLWDTAGQERFQGLGTAFYRGADCCILVYDITDLKSFQQLDEWKASFLKHCDPVHPDSFPFIVVGNKSDSEQGRRVPFNQAKQWAWMNDIQAFETSAKENVNVQRLFQEAASLALSRMPNSITYTSSMFLEPKRSQNHRFCKC